eukprot:TRINITY_DN9916_c0_g1_i1.p1 TRINITY_DN9916_c0_g1~~TRINITY_DN9916_c0_g1_i1.p1  ORF type:complete len:481 (+),score=142.23 TRINITY_DN9916_c0_g1_i1:58-1500(+)
MVRRFFAGSPRSEEPQCQQQEAELQPVAGAVCSGYAAGPGCEAARPGCEAAQPEYDERPDYETGRSGYDEDVRVSGPYPTYPYTMQRSQSAPGPWCTPEWSPPSAPPAHHDPMYTMAQTPAPVCSPSAAYIHVDNLPIHTLTSEIRDCLATAGFHVHSVEAKRGTSRSKKVAVHVCAHAIVWGGTPLVPQEERHLPLPAASADSDEQFARIQLAERPLGPPDEPVARPTVHVRVMTMRRGWAFAVSSFTAAGLVAVLEMASPGAASLIHLVSEDRSGTTTRAHPENHVSAFFVECADTDTAAELLRRCDDRRVIVDRQPFRIGVEYTRRQTSLYDQSPGARAEKAAEFVRMQAEVAPVVADLNADTHRVRFDDRLLFTFLTAEEAAAKPQWYRERLASLGYLQPQRRRLINKNTPIRTDVLAQVDLTEYDAALAAEGVSSYLDLVELDDEFLLSVGMQSMLHRRKLLRQIAALKECIDLR